MQVPVGAEEQVHPMELVERLPKRSARYLRRSERLLEVLQEVIPPRGVKEPEELSKTSTTARLDRFSSSVECSREDRFVRYPLESFLSVWLGFEDLWQFGKSTATSSGQDNPQEDSAVHQLVC